MSLVTPEWLVDTTTRRCVLVRIICKDGAGTSVTFYFTNNNFRSTDGTVVAVGWLSGNLSLRESISTDGGISITYGDIELLLVGQAQGLPNYPHPYDIIFNQSSYNWVNAPIDIYYGDETWVCANFAAVQNNFDLVFKGTIEDVDSSSPDKINWKIRDNSWKLNVPITETKIGSYGTWGGTNNQTNQDSITPLVFGEVFNITPMLIDPSLMEYYVNTGATEALIEVRDNGVPLTGGSAPTFTSSTGKFKLAVPAVGEITCSVQGEKNTIVYNADNVTAPTLSTGTYTNTIASIIGVLTTQYGVSTSRLTLADLDPANLRAFSIGTYNMPVGLYIDGNTTVLDACNQVASSVGGQIFVNRLGKLQILQLGIPTSDASIEINSGDIIEGTFKIANRTVIGCASKIGYAKNWTVQPGLITAIPSSHKETYATEWLTVTSTNSTVKTNYGLTGEPEMKDTLLLTSANATTVADMRRNLVATTRTTYSFSGTPRLMTLKLGQPVTLKHHRFGIAAFSAVTDEKGLRGTINCQVIGITPNWLKNTIEVEVMNV